MVERLIKEMIHYYANDPKRIQHFMKVHNFSHVMGLLEGLDDKTQYTLEIAAVVHDIGIKVSEAKYGSCDGKLQEKEGPQIAKGLLDRLGYEEEIIERVCYLIGHHHTYTNIQGLDYQILVEADFLVNMYDDEMSQEAIHACYDRTFRTQTGKRFCEEMYLG